MDNKNASLSCLFTLLIVIVLLSGCVTTGMSKAGSYMLRYREGLTIQEVMYILNSPPLNLEIEKVEDGTITTGPKTYEGRKVGFLRWKKKYQERTRFSVKLTTSLDKGTVFVKVYANTEERVNANYP